MTRWNAVALVLSLGAGFARAETVTKAFDAKAVKQLSVHNDSGTVEVRATDGPQATVIAVERLGAERCALEIGLDGETLRVVARNTAHFSRTRCEVDLTVTLPKSIGLDLRNGSGGVTVHGTSGDVAFAVGSGDVAIDGEVKAVDGKTGSGQVQIKGLIGGGVVKTGSGDVTLAFAKHPGRGELSVKTGSGDVTVTLPTGSQIVTTYSAGSGTLTNDVGDTPGAPFALSVRTGSGSLTVKKTP